MINPSDRSLLFGDPSLGWKQFQDLLESPAAQSLSLDQFLLFEFDRDQSSSLILRAATGARPDEALAPVDSALHQDLEQKPGVWYIPDVHDAADRLAPIASFIARLGGKSSFVARVNPEERLWGFLVGYSKESRKTDANMLSLFSLLASSVTLLVENVQLRYGTTFRLFEALSLETVNSAIVEGRSLDNTLALIIDEAVRLLHAQDALVLLLEDGGEWFRVRERRGDDVATLAHSRMTVKNSLNGMVIMTGEPLTSLDAQTDPRADQARAAGLNVHNVVIAPLKIRERTIGTIAIHNKSDGNFNQNDLNVLCSFANQAAIAIDNAQLFSDLLSARNEIQQKAQELQELLVQMMNIQENERRRIAEDIHDRVVSQIVGALYEVEGCIQVYHKSKDIDEQLQLLKQLLNEAIEQTRKSIYNLWPATLDHMSLIPALHEMFKHQETLTGLRHTIQVHGNLYPLRPSVQIAAYRIVQEAINNAYRHSAASSIDTSIHFSPQQFSIKIRDNGHGFDVRQVMQLPLGCHYGLILMRERAQSVGGSFLVKSQPGKGSQVLLEIPINEAVQEEESWEQDVNSCADR
jgi:signal transduction histidine kinase